MKAKAEEIIALDDKKIRNDRSKMQHGGSLGTWTRKEGNVFDIM